MRTSLTLLLCFVFPECPIPTWRCPFLSLSGLLGSLRESPRPGKVCKVGGEEQRAQGLRVSRHVTAAGQPRVKPQGRGRRAGS